MIKCKFMPVFDRWLFVTQTHQIEHFPNILHFFKSTKMCLLLSSLPLSYLLYNYLEIITFIKSLLQYY